MVTLGRDGGPVVGLELGGRDQSDLAVQPSVVEPIDVLGNGDLDVADVLPASLGTHEGVADALGLEQRVQRLGHRVVVTVAPRSDGGDDVAVREALRVADRSILGEFNRSMQHRLFGATVVARRRPRPGYASRGLCGAGC